jgi:hypothetical protein
MVLMGLAHFGKTGDMIPSQMVFPMRWTRETPGIHWFMQEVSIMFYVLGWLVIFTLMALWSFTVWAFHGVASWIVSQGGALAASSSGAVAEAVAETVNGAVAGAVTEATAAIPAQALPAWMAPWLDTWLAPVLVPLGDALGALTTGLAPVVDSMLQAAPSLAGLLGVAGWVIWALGAVLLLAVGAGLHLVTALWQRKGGGTGGLGGWRPPGMA